MIARKIVVRCSRCGRTFIRSTSGVSLLLPPVCGKCKIDGMIYVAKKVMKKR